MNGTVDLPPPPIPPDVDLREIRNFDMDVARVLSSKLWIISTGEEFKRAFASWVRSWHEIPAGSLPANDAELLPLLGLTSWDGVRRDVVLAGWKLHSDGRLYHRVVVKQALRVWRNLRGSNDRSEASHAGRSARSAKLASALAGLARAGRQR